MNIVSISQKMQQEDPRGFQVVERLYLQSGFDVKLGVRENGDIRIYEGVADGVGITFLSKIRVDIKGNTVIDENFTNTPYSREYVRNFIADKLISYIMQSVRRQGYSVSVAEISKKVNEILDKTFYEKVDKALLNVLSDWGVEVKVCGKERLLGNI
ncbi:MAG: hypothetical protein RMJ89_11840 [Flammeovirgaceae bacterium]|nr:hypothetical protein [Flammeovirgaceae bacterium]